MSFVISLSFKIYSTFFKHVAIIKQEKFRLIIREMSIRQSVRNLTDG